MGIGALGFLGYVLCWLPSMDWVLLSVILVLGILLTGASAWVSYLLHDIGRFLIPVAAVSFMVAVHLLTPNDLGVHVFLMVLGGAAACGALAINLVFHLWKERPTPGLLASVRR